MTPPAHAKKTHTFTRTFTSHPRTTSEPPPPQKKIHGRFVKLWAKRVLAMPEQALVPLKERDALLASKFEVRVCLWV